MKLHVAVQMDPIANIDPTKDSTFALMREAQKRGHALFCYSVEKLSLRNGVVSATGTPIRIKTPKAKGDPFFDAEPEEVRNLANVDVVLMRQDPPFDMQYLTATYLLERLHPQTFVVNNPKSVRDAPEKIFVTHFPDLTPPTLISRDPAAVHAFMETYQAIVMKPLYGNGGEAIFKIEHEDANFSTIIEMFLKMSRDPWVTQPFLKEVFNGDKRILFVEGDVAAAFNRIPAPGEIRANMVRGATTAACELSAAEKKVCEKIGPFLRENELIFTGIDVIAGLITEINVTSPTGLQTVEGLGGPDICPKIWESIEKRFAETR